MRQYTDLESPSPSQDVVLTIGSFDGVHRGHRHLLSQLTAHARVTGRLSAVLTFYPHPRAVLHPELPTRYLSTPAERAGRLAAEGLDILVILPFTRDLAELSARDLVCALYERLRMRELWVGSDFAMGRDREGSVSALRALAAEVGFRLVVVEPLLDGGRPVSSTRIRDELRHGQVEEAARLLGRPIAMEGEVVRGAGRGHSLGFPTANLRLDPTLAVPADGVYVVWAEVDGERLPAVANVGTSPSFGSEERLLEVFVLNYSGDLYGRLLRVEFVRRLRPVIRFGSPEALTRQISLDVAAARETLAACTEEPVRQPDNEPLS